LELAQSATAGASMFGGGKGKSVQRDDIKVEYSNNLPNEEYFGTIPRSDNISAMLQILERSKTIDFKITGKQVTVIPYKN